MTDKSGAAPARAPSWMVCPCMGGIHDPAPAAPLVLAIGEAAGFFKNFREHIAGQFPGLRILVRGMVGGQ